jgi:hypothetical protein
MIGGFLFLTVLLVVVAFAGINLRNCISNVRQVHTATPTLVSPLPTPNVSQNPAWRREPLALGLRPSS